MTITAEQAAKLLESTTPGPLSYRTFDTAAEVYGPGGNLIAEVYGAIGGTASANAQMFAKAPDLARALIASEAARKLVEERLSALIRRAHDAIIRDEKDGAVWAQLLADMAKEIDND